MRAACLTKTTCCTLVTRISQFNAQQNRHISKCKTIYRVLINRQTFVFIEEDVILITACQQFFVSKSVNFSAYNFQVTKEK